MHGDGKPRRDQEAAEVKRVPGMGVGTGGGQSFVLRDMPRSPGANQNSDDGDHTADRERQRRRPREDEVGNSKHEAEREAQSLRNLGIRQSANSRSRFRAITMRWISEVPSPISQIL